MTIEFLTRITQYRDTKTNIEAFSGDLEEGAIGYATNTAEFGIYTNGAWEWFGSGGAALTVEEEDGTPSVSNVTEIKVTNGTLTDNTGGSVSLDLSGSGASLTVEEEDGTPSVSNVIEIKVTNGTLTDNTGGSVSLDLSGSGASLTVEEEDGTPSVSNVIEIKVTNGKLTDNTGGSVSLDLSGAAASGFYGDVLLDNVVASGGQANFDVSSIPAGYGVIEIFLNGKSEDAGTSDGVVIAFNNDTTAANYRRSQHVAGTAHSAGNGDDRFLGDIGADGGGAVSIGQLHGVIVSPDNAVFYKVIRNTGVLRITASEQYSIDYAITWENTAAITRITLACNSGADFAEGTRCIIVGYKDH